MTVDISLKHFLKTGQLGLLNTGLSAEQIQGVLGSPQSIAETIHKHRYANIWLYGGVEVWLNQSSPQICEGIWVERLGHYWQDEFKMPVGSIVEDWDLQPYLSRGEVETYLRHNDVSAHLPEPKQIGKASSLLRELFVPASGVTLCFDEEWRLNAFHARQIADVCAVTAVPAGLNAFHARQIAPILKDKL